MGGLRRKLAAHKRVIAAVIAGVLAAIMILSAAVPLIYR